MDTESRTRLASSDKTEQQAQQLAENIAHQIVIDVGAQAARRVVVVDDAGAEIYKAQVKDEP